MCNGVISIPDRLIAGCALLPFLLHGQGPAGQGEAEGATGRAAHRGGIELRAGGQALHFFGRTSAAGQLEVAWRSAGRQAARQGPFSIGIAAMVHPMVGSWEEVPLYIGHVSALNVIQPDRPEPVANVGGMDLRANEVFLSTTATPHVTFSGFLSLSPGAQNVMVLDIYKLRDVRMDMWGVMLPVRWHFGREGSNAPRFFAEAGMGVDVLRTRATYDLTRTALTMEYQQQFIVISNSTSTYDDVSLMDGRLARDLVFTRAMFGGGASLGRLRVFLRVQRTVSAKLEQGNDTYRRARGNLFALPLLSSAWDDEDVAAMLDGDGVVPFGRTDIPRDSDTTDRPGSSDRAHGVDRFWDRTQAVLGISIRLR